jgi:RsmE family RNA methyltransferase
MNLILLFLGDFIAPGIVRVNGRRMEHVRDILKASTGETLAVGLANDRIGRGRVCRLDAQSLEMSVEFDTPPPEELPVILCLALMRPIVLRRALAAAVSMGVKSIVLFHSSRVEKSFWQSTALADAALREQMILGLEQAKDTVFPEVSFEKRFKPFVEDALPGLLRGRQGIVADPGGKVCAAGASRVPMVLVIGPEGGFVPYEIDLLAKAGCQRVGLGDRILKVETAITALLAKFFY